jgi:mannosyltransferase
VSAVATPPSSPRPSSNPAVRLADRARTTRRPPAWLVTVAGLAVLLGISAWLRTGSLNAAFWIDEAISVGVSSYGFFEVPDVLRLDGSPPLYYLLLNLWMQAFGDGEIATHTLSLIFALLCVPVAWWAGHSLYGARTGWIAALLAALNPYLTYYAQETRMYSLQALLSIVVAASFIHLFVRRDRRHLPVFVLAFTAMLYTHNWALFLGMALGLTGLWLWRTTDGEAERRAILRDGLIVIAAVVVLYAPWVPTLIHQVEHTGAPWAVRPTIPQLLGALELVLGGTAMAIALMLVAGNGLMTLTRERRDRRAIALVALTFGAIAVAWLVSQVSPAFANRYFASFVGPLILVAAVGLAHAGRLGLICLVVVAAFWLDPRTGELERKNNTRGVSASIATLVTTGDLVVATHPESLPLISYYMPKGVRYANSLGPVADPRVFDWTDATERLKRTRPTPTIDGLLRTLEPGQELVLVQPILRTARWKAPWTSLVRRRVVQWERRLDADPRVRREAVVPVFGYDRLPRGIRAIVYRVR